MRTVFLLYAINNDYYASANTFLGAYSTKENAQTAWDAFMVPGSSVWQTRPDGSVFSFYEDGCVITEETLDAPVTDPCPNWLTKK